MELTYYSLFLSRSFRADIALIGLAVMGQNLILNMNDHGFVVSPKDSLLAFLGVHSPHSAPVMVP